MWVDPGRRRLLETRRDVVQGWIEIADRLAQSGERELSTDVIRFTEAMAPPQTDKQKIATELLEVARTRERPTKVIGRAPA